MLSRRNFLKAAGLAAGLTAISVSGLAACSKTDTTKGLAGHTYQGTHEYDFGGSYSETEGFYSDAYHIADTITYEFKDNGQVERTFERNAQLTKVTDYQGSADVIKLEPAESGSDTLEYSVTSDTSLKIDQYTATMEVENNICQSFASPEPYDDGHTVIGKNPTARITFTRMN